MCAQPARTQLSRDAFHTLPAARPLACTVASDMARIRVVILVAAIFLPAASQAQNAVDVTPQLVNIARFRQSHPAFSFLTHGESAATMFANGQVPNYGGPLQNYWNSERIYPLREVMTPFGGSGVVQIAGGRVQFLGSFGGVFVPTATSYTRPNAWLTQTSIGGRVALDQGHHFWVGGTARHMVDFADRKRQWGLLSADFTFQSGR